MAPGGPLCVEAGHRYNPGFAPAARVAACRQTRIDRSRPVIDALKSDEIVQKLGGRFKLTALIQRRLGEIINGARPLVERNGRSDFEVVIEEIVQEKITIDWEASGLEQLTA